MTADEIIVRALFHVILLFASSTSKHYPANSSTNTSSSSDFNSTSDRAYLNYGNHEDEKPPFTLVDEDGSPVEGEELGLLLYEGGTVCDDSFDKTAAYAICRRMGYGSATAWTSGEVFYIQSKYDITLDDVSCSYPEWESCSFTEFHNCGHSEDVFLSCSWEDDEYPEEEHLDEEYRDEDYVEDHPEKEHLEDIHNSPESIEHYVDTLQPTSEELLESRELYCDRNETGSCFLGKRFPRGCCENKHFCCGNSWTGVCCHRGAECNFDKYGGRYYCHHSHWTSLASIPGYWLIAVLSYLVLSRKLRKLKEATVVAHNAVQYTVTNPQFIRPS